MTKFSRSALLRKTLLLGSVGTMAFCVAAHAQTDQQQLETVTVTGVTGSHVIATAAESPTPLTIVTADQLQATTPTNIPDGLNKLPVFQGSVTIRRSGDGSGGYGTAGVQGGNLATNVLNLRSFGSQRTLTLLDGHRAAPGNSDGTVDIDTLPQMLVQRVDIVTGGAGAVYGSDAVTGVVNFVLDKKFTGFKLDANTGLSNYGDSFGYNGGIAVGTNLFGGRGHIEASAEYRHKDGFLNWDRPYGPGIEAQVGAGTAANPFAFIPNGRRPNSTFGGLVQGCVPACGAANQMQFVGTGVLGPFYAGIAGAKDANGNTTAGTSNQNSGGDGAYSPYTSAYAAYHQAATFARFDYDVTPNVAFHVQAQGAEGYTTGYHFNQKLTPGANQADLFYKNNPYLTAAAQTALGNDGTTPAQVITNKPDGTFTAPQPSNTFQLGKFITNLGKRNVNRDTNVDTTLAVQTGFDGSLLGDRFTWNVFFTHAENRLKVTLLNNQDYQKLYAAEDAVIDPATNTIKCYAAIQAATKAKYADCVPMNAFGPDSVTQAAFDYTSVTTYFVQTNVLNNAGGGISGTVWDGWAGPIKAALSAEARWNDYNVVTNQQPNQVVDCTGLRLCSPIGRFAQAVLVPVSASNHVWEVAGEAEIPVLKNLPFARSLEFNIAGRYTDYSTSGSVETWKMGLVWQALDSLRFRGTTSIDIRAPTLNDLNQPPVSVVQGFNDLHTGLNGTLQIITQGNSKLVPEVARTYTAGVVLTPDDFIPGLTVSLDYFNITLKNAITAINGQNSSIQSLCETSNGTSDFCSLYIRPNGFSDHSTANYPSKVYSEVLNAAWNKTEGWDFETNYAFDMADIAKALPGSVKLRGMASYQPVIKSIQFAGAPWGRTTYPHTRLTGSITYNLDKWTVGVQDRWLSGYSLVSGAVTASANNWVNPHVNHFNLVDFVLKRDFEAGEAEYSAYFNIQNVFNTQPMLLGSGTNIGLNYPVPSGQDIMGRYFTIGIRINQ